MMFTAEETWAVAGRYLCSNVEGPEGFECTGKAPQS